MKPNQPNPSEPVSGSFTVPADHPCLPGHFPGLPIVPGVVLLDLSCAVLLRARPDLGAPREIKAAKFMRPVKAGDVVRVSFAAATGVADTLRFSCETDSGLVAQGQIVFSLRP